MKPNPPALAAAERADLRLRAEAQWQREHSAGAAAPAATDDPTLVHALQVHAIELEMQNEELRASRAAVEAGLARYTELYDFAPVGYFELDRQGVIGRLNLAAATLLGTERARLIGERLGGCVEEGDRPAFADFLFRVWASAAPQIREVRIPLAGQSLRTIELRATRDDDGLNCLVVAVDITARRQTEQALRESEQRWRLALDGVGDGLWDLDVPSGQVYFSRRWKEMLGFAENEVGTDLTDSGPSRVHPEDADRVMADLQAHLEGRTAHYTNEHRLRCKDGSYKWVLDRGTVFSRDAQGRPLRVLGTHTDITPGKATQESLRLLALVLDQIQDHVTVTDLDGIVTYVNQAQKQALQFDLTGLPVTRFNEGLATDAPQRRIAEATLKAGRWQGTVVNRRLNGSEFLVDLRTTLVRNQDGRPVAMVGVGTDVTASKAAEQALRDSETRFRSYFNLPLIGIAITAADKGWIEVNPRLCEIYGYSGESWNRSPGPTSPTPTTWPAIWPSTKRCWPDSPRATPSTNASSARTGRWCTAPCRRVACEGTTAPPATSSRWCRTSPNAARPNRPCAPANCASARCCRRSPRWRCRATAKTASRATGTKPPNGFMATPRPKP
jgi:PAS domain S-box-containing protein